MQGLSSFGSFNPLTELPQPVAAAVKPSAKTMALPAVDDRVSSSASASTAFTGTAQAAAPAHASSSSVAAAQGGSTLTAGQIAQEELVSGYAMTVGKQQYAADVEESGGNYTVSVENLVGGTATGNTELAAENNLQLRIDELV
jgi:hypothetical protein